MIEFKDVDQLFQCAANCRIIYHPVSCQDISDYVRCLRQIKRLLGDAAASPFWGQFLARLRRYQFDLVSSALPFNHPSIIQEGMLKNCEQAQIKARQNYPHIRNSLATLTSVLSAVMESNSNPLLACILSLLREKPDSTTALLLKEGRHLCALREQLSSQVDLPSVLVVQTRSLLKSSCYSRLLVIGSADPRWYPDWVFGAPRTKEFHIVCFSVLKSRRKAEPYFPKSLTKPSVSSGSIPTNEIPDNSEESSEILEASEVLPQLDMENLASRCAQKHTGTPEMGAVPCRLFILADDSAVWLETSEHAHVYALLPGSETDYVEDTSTSIERRSVRDLKPGFFVFLRVGDNSDYVAQLADKVLGNRAEKARLVQNHWKLLLEQAARTEGFLEVSVKLLDLGADRANEQNVRNWISGRSIKPQNLVDFEAIMRLIGLEDSTRDYWAIMRTIMAAHLKAGRLISRQLMDLASSSSLSILYEKGTLDFELPQVSGVTLRAYRIDVISAQTNYIPLSNVERPFRVEEELWHA